MGPPCPGGAVLLEIVEGTHMEANLDFLGLMNLLRGLLDAGLVSQTEARRVAARLKVKTGADLVLFL